VALPPFLIVGWPHAIHEMCLIAFVSFGAGYAVEALVWKARQSE
jgi:hypothetical protein